MTKPPTITDKKILTHLEQGNKINHITALNKFKTTGLRDSIFRLRKAGYPIISERVNYKTEEGKAKNFVRYKFQES